MTSCAGVERVCRRDRLGLCDCEFVTKVEDPPELTKGIALADAELPRSEVESRSVGASEEALEVEGREFCSICARVLDITEFTEGVEVLVLIDSLDIVV